MKTKFCIGTAQFGMKYGITNKKGRTRIGEMRKIINLCENYGIKYIDTAMNYGSSEKNLGKCIKNNSKFKIITKIAIEDVTQNGIFSTTKAERALQGSFKKLRVCKLEGLLVHTPSILGTNEGECLLNWMKEKKEDGQIDNIGISIYEKNEISEVKIKNIDIVQLPISVFDQRIIRNGGIKWLKDNGVKIFARSIFMQGILLSKNLTGYKLSKEMIKHHQRWKASLKEKNLTQLEECINFVSSIESLEAITIGVESAEHLIQILQIEKRRIKECSTSDYLGWNWAKIEDIDPRKWRTNKEKSL
ncbi:aldo/keto reductase [Synechococcus sp. CC9616]|uniref:aldo/keto reductase n=1 Tax=Synechococcus sp. CC9616 TaxID=110663 RepID=UPI0004AE21E2|nr:aldo/keto reductase [Synechococcus sp. CC9616]